MSQPGNGGGNDAQNDGSNQPGNAQGQPSNSQQANPQPNQQSQQNQQHYSAPAHNFPPNYGGYQQPSPGPFDEFRQTLAGLPEAVSRAVRESFPVATPPEGSAQNNSGNQNQNQQNNADTTNQQNNAGNGSNASNASTESQPKSPYRNAFQKWWFEG